MITPVGIPDQPKSFLSDKGNLTLEIQSVEKKVRGNHTTSRLGKLTLQEIEMDAFIHMFTFREKDFSELISDRGKQITGISISFSNGKTEKGNFYHAGSDNIDVLIDCLEKVQQIKFQHKRTSN